MIHEPYENWILSETELTIEEKAALHNHLQECSQCWKLGNNWRNIRSQFSIVSMSAPADGFSQRWKASADARRELKMRNQLIRLFLLMGGMAFVSILTLAIQFVIVGSPIDWVMRSTESTLRLFMGTAKYIEAFASAFRFVPPTVAFATWGLLAAGFSILALLWVYMMWRTSKGEISNEELL